MAEREAGLPAADRDGAARAAAFAAIPALEPSATVVPYGSRGRVLVIGPGPAASEQADALPPPLACTVLAVEGEPGPGVAHAARGVPRELRGHLGAFRVTVDTADGEIDLARSLGEDDGCFDLVLDLQREPCLERDLSPPGYFAPRGDPARLADALAAIPDLVGEFEKPQYVRLDPSLCAHRASGVEGCRRCLDVCPADAIGSAAASVEFDPYLCQGGGVCASACPSGALRYQAPPADLLAARLRALIETYREAGGERPVVLLHGAERGAGWVEERAAGLPGNVLPIALEEAAGAGPEIWLGLVALGAAAVVVLLDDAAPPVVVAAVERQRAFVGALLDALGLPAEALAVVGEAGPHDWTGVDTGIPPATFDLPDEKRTALRMAVDHLHRHAPARPEVAPLPPGAPFGEAVVDAEKCTLCMACAGLCPSKALVAAGDTPRLQFVEQNCVQCGLCVAGCPERAVALEPRFLFTPARRERRVLHEEEPFRCISCGKPFATATVIARMRDRLADHPMFAGAAARRLEMCEDCRVRDLFQDGGGMLDQ